MDHDYPVRRFNEYGQDETTIYIPETGFKVPKIFLRYSPEMCVKELAKYRPRHGWNYAACIEWLENRIKEENAKRLIGLSKGEQLPWMN